MSVITSLNVPVGGSEHVTAQVLDQYGNVMPLAIPTISDTSVNTSFTPDSGTVGAGVVDGETQGTDTLTASYGGLSASIPITVTPAASVPTSIQFTSP